MFATMAFVRNGDLDDTFALAGLLVHDDHDLVRKVVGGMLAKRASTIKGVCWAFWTPMPPRRRASCVATPSSTSTQNSGRTTCASRTMSAPMWVAPAAPGKTWRNRQELNRGH